MSAIGSTPAALADGIPALAFSVEDASRVPHAAVPTLRFGLRIAEPGGRRIRSVMLDVQIQIAARRRSYDEAAHDRLFELFGAPKDWGTTLRTMLWTRTTVIVPPFEGSTVVDVPVACSYDLEVVASRYFDALAGGEVPLEFVFGGTVLYDGPDGGLQLTRISLDEEAEFRLPVALWKETMDAAFPGTAWLRVGKDAFDRLSAFKSRNALPTWDAALDRLLEERDE